MSHEFALEQIILSPCETFHLINDAPLYSQRFSQVMKFHKPGLAPAKDNSGAFHINTKGNPAYLNRFIDSFGFYEGFAAVMNEDGWFHIKTNGEACYTERFNWCGNFQEGFSTVNDKFNNYFHINPQGQKAYKEKYNYVGDFKDGVAVVCNRNGLHSHINYDGNLIHKQWFVDLDVYHKGYARAKDSAGWHHINKAGKSIYSQRYAQIEPFYNGIARVETFEGALITINIKNKKITELRPSIQKPWQQLSGDMIGFWRTEIIATAVRIKLFDYLPNTINDIVLDLGIAKNHITRLLRALWELDLVTRQENYWQLTKKGKLLSPQNESFLAAAAVMWSDVNASNWKSLSDLITKGYDQYHTVFKAAASEKQQELYHRAIDGYALVDFQELIDLIDWHSHQKVIGIGRSAKVLLESALQKYVHIQALLIGEKYVLKNISHETLANKQFSMVQHDILQPFPQCADAIFLPKILHYWPDQQVLLILKNAHQALSSNGKIYLLEMILDEHNPNGSMLDINMYVESGGKLRFLSDWRYLFDAAKLKLKKTITISPWLNLLMLEA